MNKKLMFLTAVIVIGTLLIAACAPAAATTEAPAAPAAPAATEAPAAPAATEAPAALEGRYPKVTIGIAADPQDLTPNDVNGGSKPYIYQNIYEYLFDLANNEYVPILAKGYTKIDDTHYQVQLYDYIYDSAGNHITADDVVFATNWLISTGKNYRYDIFKSIKKIDDYTVEYEWTRPVTGVGELEFPWTRTVIFSQKAFEEGNFATAPVATGPYVVKEFVSGSKVVLEANDNYWQKPELRNERHLANVQTIEYDVISEPAQHVIALQTGAIDFSELVPVENLPEFEDGGKYADQFDVLKTFGSLLVILTMNQTEGMPASDINFRNAVYCAIDNEAVATATNGMTTAAKAFGTPHFSDYVKSWGDEVNCMTAPSVDKAKEFLAKTNYKGEKVKLVVLDAEPFKTAGTVVQAFLQNAGINAEITLVQGKELGGMFADPTAYDIILGPIGGGAQIGEWNRVMNNSEFGNGMAAGFIKDDKLQELFKAASNVDTHTPENMTALHDYYVQNAYGDAIIIPVLNLVFFNHIKDLVLRENEFFMPGSSTYQ